MLQTALETGLRQSMYRMVRPLLHPAVPTSVQRALIRQAYLASIPPRGCQFEEGVAGGVPVTQTLCSEPGKHVVLYLHGGAYIIGSPKTHRGITGHLAKFSGAAVVAADYRLAPEHPFPAAVDDAETVYQALLDEGYDPSCIAIAGDSAGGGLSLALAMRLRDDKLPMPSSITLFSPWTDLTHTQLYSPECEPVLQQGWIEKAAGLYCGRESRTHPLISPVHGDLTGLPPLLIQVGSQEILLNDAQRLADAANRDSVDVTLEIYNSLWHVFQVHAGQLARATKAMVVAGEHIRRHMAL